MIFNSEFLDWLFFKISTDYLLVFNLEIDLSPFFG